MKEAWNLISCEVDMDIAAHFKSDYGFNLVIIS